MTLACVALVVVGLTAGCGSSTNSTSTGSAAPSPTGSVIKIGVIEPEGTASYNAPDLVGMAEATVLAANAAGGINGHRLDIDYCNSQNDPNATAACTRKLIADKVALVSPAIDVLGPQMVKAFQAAGVPVVNVGANYPQEYTSPVAFVVTSGPTYLAAQVVAAAHAGLKKIFYIANDLGAGTTADVNTIETVASHLGMTYVGDSLLPQTGVTDYTPNAQAAINSRADAIMVEVAATQGVATITALKALGSTATIISGAGGITDGDISKYASTLNGALMGCETPPPSVATEAQFPGVKAFADQMAAGVKAGIASASLSIGHETDMELGWATLQGVFSLMKSISGHITASSMLHALNTTHSVSLQGVLPDWDPSTVTTLPGFGKTRVSETNEYACKVENGKLQLVSNTPTNVAKYFS